MSNIGVVWIREDFRIENNAALSYATQNHNHVIALYIYNNNDKLYKTTIIIDIYERLSLLVIVNVIIFLKPTFYCSDLHSFFFE